MAETAWIMPKYYAKNVMRIHIVMVKVVMKALRHLMMIQKKELRNVQTINANALKAIVA